MVLSVACGNALLYVVTSLLHLSANMVPIRFGSIDIEVRSAHAGATPNTVAAAVACAAAVGRANDTWHDDVQAGLKFANLMNKSEPNEFVDLSSSTYPISPKNSDPRDLCGLGALGGPHGGAATPVRRWGSVERNRQALSCTS